jgi:hypothetical protein
MAQPETSEPRCDACGDDGSPYADLPALTLCTECAAHLDKERRIHSNGWSGPLPHLTAFRLGTLAASFIAPKLMRKLERLAETL